MDLEIDYLPKHYYSEPEAGGSFPFALDDIPKYVIDMSDIYLLKIDRNFLPLWMEKLNAFPVHFCAELPFDWKDEYEETCKKWGMAFTYESKNQRNALFTTFTEVKN
ncbi:MAG: hypothetical protein ACQEWV_14090 [Bacillota bacterium]